jgi:probable phosphoglycerate mutase
MTTIYLIRHAHTDAVGQYLAEAALDLNDQGRTQVAQLVERLRRVPFDAVVSSPLSRTRQTAQPIADDHGLEVTLVPELTEFEFGAWSGSTFVGLGGDERWRRFNLVRSITRPDGGELMLAVQLRAVTTILALRERYPFGTVAVVSHGDVIRAALLHFLGMPMDFLHRLELSPAGISVIELSETAVRVVQVNGGSAPSAG